MGIRKLQVNPEPQSPSEKVIRPKTGTGSNPVRAATSKETIVSSDPAYECRGYVIPARMMSALKRYVDHGIKPGDFLVAIISNDLKSAIFHADDENLPNLSAYVSYLYLEAPGNCWGSRQKMLDWINIKRIHI